MTAAQELATAGPVAAIDGADRNRAWRWLLAVAVLVPPVLVAVGWTIAPPILSPDSAMGFLVWQSRAAGAAWNHLQTVDPADISRDCSAFLSWWSPGQYEIPGLLRQLGFSWGHAMLLTTLAASWLATCGAWRLARAIGGSRRAAAAFCAVNALEWHSLYGFGQFCGGDVVLSAAAPWILLWGWRVHARPWWFTASVPFVLVGGFFLKLSSGLLTLPVLAGAGLGAASTLRRRRRTLGLWALVTAMAAAGAWLVVRVGYLDRAPNPGDFGHLHRPLASVIGFSALAPWLAATGAQSFVNHLLWSFGRDAAAFWASIRPVSAALAVCASGAALTWIWHTRRRGREAVILLTVTAAALLGVLLWRGATIYLDDRYLRPVATVLLLAWAAEIDSSRQWRRLPAIVGLSLIAAFGTAAAAQRSWRLAAMHQRGCADVTQQQLSPAALAECARINASTASGAVVVYVPSPEIAFEFPQQRVLATGDINDLRLEPRHGRVPRLLVLTSDAMEANGRGPAVRKSFVDYRDDEWRGEHRGAWWFWTASAAGNPRNGE